MFCGVFVVVVGEKNNGKAKTKNGEQHHLLHRFFLEFGAFFEKLKVWIDG